MRTGYEEEEKREEEERMLRKKIWIEDREEEEEEKEKEEERKEEEKVEGRKGRREFLPESDQSNLQLKYIFQGQSKNISLQIAAIFNINK